jgi:23S rRNA pseudouridine955/2504/2580 synthase
MNDVRQMPVAADEAGLRLDRWFKQHFPGLPHGRLERLLRTGQVRVDGARAKSGLRLAAGQLVRVPPLKATPVSKVARPVDQGEAEALKARVLFRDEEVLALDKPAGLAVQGGSGQTRHLDGLLDALRFGSAERPRLVHRLDQDTSGVLLLARTPAAARRLSAQFRRGEIDKLYWAIVVGVPEPAVGRIDAALAKRGRPGGERVAVDEAQGRPAATDYVTLDRAGKRAALLALRPLTGRTHQLRAHLAAIGTPILGDAKYGGMTAFLPGMRLERRLHLHARRLRLELLSGKEHCILAPAPAHFVDTAAALGFVLAEARDPFADARMD